MRTSLKTGIALVLLVPVLALIGLGGRDAYTRFQDQQTLAEMIDIVVVTPVIGELVHELQRERGTSAGFIASQGAGAFASRLDDQKTATDVKLAAVTRAIDALKSEGIDPAVARWLSKARGNFEALPAMRRKVVALEVSVGEMAGFYTETIGALLKSIEQIASTAEDGEVMRSMTVIVALLEAKERAGLERAMGAAGFGKGAFDPAVFERFVSLIGQQKAFLDIYTSFARPKEQAGLDQVMTSSETKAVDALREVAVASVFTGDLQGIASTEWFDTITRKIDLFKALEDDLSGALLTLLDTRRAEARARLLIELLVVGGALTVSIVLGMLLVASMVGRLERVKTAMLKVADHDFTIQVPFADERTEIGDMARAVEVFKQNGLETRRLQEAQEQQRRDAAAEKKRLMADLAGSFRADVGDVVRSVTVASGQLKTSAETLSASSSQTLSQSSAVASATQQASTNVQTVASAAQEMTSSMEEISRQAAVSSTVAQEAGGAIGKTEHTVNGVHEESQAITEIVALIDDIAAKTNLLALNATIEAARAGEAGKGFAVVASEVKTLAHQTADATQKIRDRVDRMQGVSAQAVTAIEEIKTVVSRVSEAATAISAAVEEQQAATAEIVRSMQEAARGTEHVTSAIAGVSGAAEQTGSSAAQVLSVANDLATRSQDLSGKVTAFVTRLETA